MKPFGLKVSDIKPVPSTARSFVAGLFIGLILFVFAGNTIAATPYISPSGISQPNISQSGQNPVHPLQFPTTEFSIDGQRTTITLFTSHLGMKWRLGQFNSINGAFSFNPDLPETGTVYISVATDSIRTANGLLDRFLQSENFLNSNQYPEMSFASHQIETTGDNIGLIHGTLTLRGITKPVTLKAHFKGIRQGGPDDHIVAQFSAKTKVRRSDFGINKFMLIGDNITVEIEMQGYPIALQASQ